ncbi:MAG TPA: hypothetical protein VI854_06110, partial [Acidimicrobiia bacterium]|nr:hypothetical protein [Acidimicrobiia bacterium]
MKTATAPPTVSRARPQPPGDRPREPLLIAAVALAVLVVAGAQVVRAMFPAMFLLGEDTDFLAAGAVALAVFAAPVVAAFLPGLPGSAAGRVSVGGFTVAAALVAVAWLDPIPVALAMTATAVVLVGVALAAGGLARGLAAEPDGDVVLCAGLLLGLAVDTALRSATYGWDLIWQGGWAPLAVLALLVVAV